MLDADVIRKSRLPWSFPVVIEDKKMVGKRFLWTSENLIRLQRKTPILCL